MAAASSNACSSASRVPTLESLALAAVAENVHQLEPETLKMLPFGGGERVIRLLVKSGRLRPETLRPLLSDWSSCDALSEQLGEPLVAAAPGCRGLAALAAQRLSFQSRCSSAASAAQMEPAHAPYHEARLGTSYAGS